VIHRTWGPGSEGLLNGSVGGILGEEATSFAARALSLPVSLGSRSSLNLHPSRFEVRADGGHPLLQAVISHG